MGDDIDVTTLTKTQLSDLRLRLLADRAARADRRCAAAMAVVRARDG